MADTEYEVTVRRVFATEDEACDWARQFRAHGYTVTRCTTEVRGGRRYIASEIPVLIVNPQNV